MTDIDEIHNKISDLETKINNIYTEIRSSIDWLKKCSAKQDLQHATLLGRVINLKNVDK